MSATILKGAPLVEALSQRIQRAVEALDQEGILPTLAIVDATGEPSVQLFSKAKEKACARLGMHSRLFRLPAVGAARELEVTLKELGVDPRFHGIILERPLPAAYESIRPTEMFPPEKDVAGVHPYNIGRILCPPHRFLPTVPAACVQLLDHYGVKLKGRRVVIVGGEPRAVQPLSLLLSLRQATVTLCLPTTRDLPKFTRQAEIVISAADQPGRITASTIAPGAVVVDMGSTLTEEGEVVGDIDFQAVRMIASAVVPCQGGIGPVATTLLLWNAVEACRQQNQGRSSKRNRL